MASPDPDALNLVKHSAEGIAETIKIALQRFYPESEKLPIVCQGGMFEHSNLYRQTVREIVKQSYPNDIKIGAFRTVVGAGLMACAKDGILPEPSVRDSIIDSIHQLPSSESSFLVYPTYNTYLD
jgi:hypothetical protein